MHPKRPVPARRRSLLPAAVAAAATLATVALAAPAGAQQQGFSLAQLQPAFAGDRLFGIPSAYTASRSGFYASLLLDYAHNPLVLRTLDTGKDLGAIVSDQMLLHLDASYALGRVVTFNVDVPFGFQRGESPMGGGLTFGPPTSAAVADLRLGARATIVGDVGDAFQLAAEALVWLPTGSQAAFTGDGTVRSMPMLVAGGSSRYLVWSADVGADLRPEQVYATNVAVGPAMRWGAGVGFLPGDGSFQVGPELTGGVGLKDTGPRTVDLEALLGAKVRFAKRFEAGYAASLGLTHGVGTPDFRSVLSIAYAPPPEAPPQGVGDRDKDGIPDAEDACPDQPGPRDPDPGKNGCPVIADRDGDGIPDAEDACPDKPGVRDPVPAINGCPPDRDNDGIPDAEDACPDQIGPPSPDPKKNGCPVAEKVAAPPTGDRDKDGIADDKDACPDDKGVADPNPEKNGCPKDVRVTEGQIVLLEQFEFEPSRAALHASSDALLDTVAAVLRAHPEMVKVEVQGHTDNKGPADVNTAVSQKRAEAVVAALVKRGIDPGRLVAKGYGPTRPIFANITTAGRQKNRRVEIHILERRKTP